MAQTKSTNVSPPPSPSALLKAQILVTKAAQKKAKAKKTTKSKAEKENNGKSVKAAAPAEGKARRVISISSVTLFLLPHIKLICSVQLGKARKPPLHQCASHSD